MPSPMIPGIILDLAKNTLLLLCGYRSFKALESERNDDDKKWLTFWFVYTVFSFVKSVCDYVAFAVPFYEEASLGLIVFLAFFGGSKMAYSTVLQPLLKKHEAVIDETLQDAAKKAEEYGGKNAAAVFVSPDKGKAE